MKYIWFQLSKSRFNKEFDWISFIFFEKNSRILLLSKSVYIFEGKSISTARIDCRICLKKKLNKTIQYSFCSFSFKTSFELFSKCIKILNKKSLKVNTIKIGSWRKKVFASLSRLVSNQSNAVSNWWNFSNWWKASRVRAFKV